MRSRDPSVLDTCDIVVDVGGTFDPSRHRYDHHQRSFDESMHSLSAGKFPWKTKLSSAGLVYYHFGMRSGERDMNALLLARVCEVSVAPWLGSE